MKRFCFRLESVRSLRALREQRSREAFAVATEMWGRAQEAVKCAEANAARLSASFAASRLERFRPAEQVAGSAVFANAQAEISRLITVREDAASTHNTAHDKWLELRRSLQVIEKLAERDRSLHHVATLRAEQNELDEFASIAAARDLRRS